MWKMRTKKPTRARRASMSAFLDKRIRMNKKRGQITLPIILGLLLLILIILGAYLFINSQQPTVGPGETTKIPVQLQPVNKFVTDCLKSATEDAIRVVMEHGGYADFTKLKANTFQPTEADSVEYSPDSDYLVPYWSYMKSKNTCTSGCQFSSMVKPICREGSIGKACITKGRDSVEEEIDWYIKQNIQKCLNNFVTFQQAQMKVELVGDTVPKTTIRNGSVNVYLEMPLKVTYQSTVQNINTFTADVDTSIAELYKVGVEILNYESTGCMIEDHTLNMIAFYQGLDSKKLPPYSASSMGKQASTMWVIQNVEKKIRSVTSLAMQQIRVFNTKTYPYSTVDATGPNAKAMQAVYDQFVFQPLSEFHEVQVNFVYYPWWNPYIKIDPSRGSLIGPSWMLSGSGSGWLSYLVNKVLPKEYEYYYHYSFPVVAEIRKWDEKNQREELLRFAMEPNIRANKCFSSAAEVVTQGAGETLLCEPEFLGDQQYTVRVKDEFSGKPVMGAEVLFYAGESCSLGFTDSSGKLITKLPSATGGFLDIKANSYLEYFLHEQDFSLMGDIKVKPLVNKTVDISIFNESNMRLMNAMDEATMKAFRKQVSYKPDSTLGLIATISREKDNYHDGVLEQTISIALDSNGKLAMTPKSIQLAPGNYNVEIMLINNVPITVEKEYDRICANCNKNPKSECTSSPNWKQECDASKCDWQEGSACTKTCWQETDCYKWGFTCGGGCDADEEIIYDYTDMSAYPNGGVLFDLSTSFWNIADYSVLTDPLMKEVRFYVVQQNKPFRHYMLETLDAYRAYSKNYLYLFMPEYTNG